MTTMTTNNDRSLLPLQTNMTEAGTGGTTAKATTKDKDVVDDMAIEADEVDKTVVDNMEVNPPDSINSIMVPTKITEAASPGMATEAPTEDIMEMTTSR